MIKRVREKCPLAKPDGPMADLAGPLLPELRAGQHFQPPFGLDGAM